MFKVINWILTTLSWQLTTACMAEMIPKPQAHAHEKPMLYFAYGSNMWKDQMARRCPDSQFQGIAKLYDYKWIINKRGYANIVSANTTTSPWQRQGVSGDPNYGRPVVWGLLYTLSDNDEAKLDVNEGVPHAYTKEFMDVSGWSVPRSDETGMDAKAETMRVLVYVDRERLEEGVAREEYVGRMNEGIGDAVGEGVSVQYVVDVLRPFIPVVDERDGRVEGVIE